MEEIRSRLMYFDQSAFPSAEKASFSSVWPEKESEAKLSETYSVTPLRGSFTSEYVAFAPRSSSLLRSQTLMPSGERLMRTASSDLMARMSKSTCLPSFACCTRDIMSGPSA